MRAQVLHKTADSTTLTPDKFDIATVTREEGKVRLRPPRVHPARAWPPPAAPGPQVKYTPLSEAESAQVYSDYKKAMDPEKRKAFDEQIRKARDGITD